MKLIFYFLLTLSIPAFSQVENVQLGADFKDASTLGSRQSGFESLQTYSSGIVNGSQFFYPTWANGTVTTINNETIANKYLLLFDKVRQQLFMKYKDSSFILLADKKQVKSFTVTTDRIHYFVPASTYDVSKKEGFFEILVNNADGYTLLKMVKTKFVKADMTDIEKVRLGEINDAFEDEPSYFVCYKNATLQPILLKERSIRKVLQPVKTKVDDYFTNRPDVPVNETLLIDLLQSINI